METEGRAPDAERAGAKPGSRHRGGERRAQVGDGGGGLRNAGVVGQGGGGNRSVHVEDGGRGNRAN